MRAPDKLGAAGKRAWEHAMQAIEGLEGAPQLYDAAERYARQVDLADKARRVWRREGEPLLEVNPNGAAGQHPLLKVIENADKLALRFEGQLGIKAQKQKHRGPDPKAVIQAQGVGESPAAKLRRVK